MKQKEEMVMRFLTFFLPFLGVSFLFTFFWFLVRPIEIERYCIKSAAEQIPRAERSKWVVPNEKEVSYFAKRKEKPEVITKTFRAEIECRLEQRYKLWPGI